MPLQQVLALLVLLLFFWYVAGGSDDPGVVRPVSRQLTADPDNIYAFHQVGDQYRFHFSGQSWDTDLPEEYYFISSGAIRAKDPCYTVPDHGKVLATGHLLYEHLQKEQLQSGPNSPIEIDASSAFQDQKVFYFECLNRGISRLHQCPPGHVFRNKDCLNISLCLDQPDGTRFPDPTNSNYYYQCKQSRMVRKSCVKSWFFDYNRCQGTSFQYFCQQNTFKVLNENTLLVCDRNRAIFETCPPGFRYFENPLDTEKPVCEASDCVGVPDGEKKPLPAKQEHGLVYTPGYVTCQKDRVQEKVECSREWDTFSTDAPLPLPLVFDVSLQDCTVPKLCENVQPQNSDVVIPVREWTQHLPLWKYSPLMDRVTGYHCDASGTRARISAPEGYWIGRNMTMESACQDSTTTMVPVSGTPSRYYDCVTQQTKSCGNDSFFNGETCQAYVPHAFQYNALDVYGMDSLNWDFWMSPFHYESFSPSDISLKNNCKSPFSYNNVYNICVHRECVAYPFLSQIDFLIGLRNGSTCQYNTSTRYLEKMDPISDEKYLYWTQRMTHDPSSVDNEPCQEGQSIRSGKFAYDKTIFATCDPRQPFVFCPSPLTLGIEKQNGVFTCKPDDRILARGKISPGETRTFMWNELHQLSSTIDTTVQIDMHRYPMKANQPLDLTALYKKKYRGVTFMTIQTTQAEITFYYKARNSHPPNVARLYRDGSFSRTETDKSDASFYHVKYGKFINPKTHYVVFKTFTPRPLLPELQ